MTLAPRWAARLVDDPGYSSAEADLRAHLDQLESLEFEQQRRSLAKKYHVRVEYLDRTWRELKGTGQPERIGLEIESPEPWPDWAMPMAAE